MATQVRLASGEAQLPLESPLRSPRRRVRWRRRVALALRVVAILGVSYLIVANVLLRTRLLRDAISGPDLGFAINGSSTDLRLEYQDAYSILPGRVHVNGLTIRGRERTLEWLLTIDHADVSVSFIDILRRSFHATSASVNGCSLRARLRLDPKDATPDIVAALPPIAGFPDPPLLDPGPDPTPLADASSKLWMVELEDVDVEHVRELWIHTVRSEGDARVRGRWLFHPRQSLEIGPAAVDANGVDVSYGGRLFASGLRGSVLATVHPFDVQQASGGAIFDHVSYSGTLRGRALIPGALHSFAPQSGVSSKRCEGPLDTQLVLDHGKLKAGSRILTEATDCRLEAKGLEFTVAFRTELKVDAEVATIQASVEGLRISHLGVERARVASVAATVTSRQLQASRVFDDALFSVDFGGAKTNDIAGWKQFFPSTSGFVIGSGLVTADGHADGSLAERRGRGSLRLSARRLRAERGSDRFTADVTGEVRLVDVSLSGGSAVGAATIVANDVAASVGPRIFAGGFAANVELPHATWTKRTFDFSGSSIVFRALSATSHARGAAILRVPELSAVAPRFTLAPSGTEGHVSIDLPRAELVDLGRLRELVPLPAGVRIDRGSGRAKLHAQVELGSGSMRGEGDVVVRGARARLGSTRLFGDLAVVVKARRAGGATGGTDVSGSTLTIEHAGTGNAVPPENTWWADIALGNATLRTQGGVRFDAKAHLRAKDATPATVLVSQNTGVPGWAADLFRMPALDASAEVRFAPSSVEVRSLVASGGSTSLRAEYAKRRGRQDGAVLMDLGWIAVGYDMTDGATGPVLIGPEYWFEQKAKAMHRRAGSAEKRTDAAEGLERYAAMTEAQRKHEAEALAAECTPQVRSCDATSIEILLRAARDAGERDRLRGIMHAPLLVAAAKRGSDGRALDPMVIGSLVEILRIGGESTLDSIPRMAQAEAALDSNAARGKVITVSGRASPIRREGTYSVGTLATESGVVHFVTPFATEGVSESFARFRGVFVQRYTSTNEPPSFVLVGAFSPPAPSAARR